MPEQNGHSTASSIAEIKKMATTQLMSSMGSTSSGGRTFDGRTYDPFVQELSGSRAIRTYSEMESNDPIVGAILFAIETLIRQVSWWAQPYSQRPKDLQAAQYLDECINDMSVPWGDVIVDVLSMLPFGWSYHEQIYKYRRGDKEDPKEKSKHSDGLIGWRKWPIRSQESLLKWEFQQDKDGIAGMWQQTTEGSQRYIPIEKALLFKTVPAKGSPEGRSILRRAYRPWYFKRHMEEIEGIGIERELAGLPFMQAPEDVDIWATDDTDMTRVRNEAMNLMKGVRRNEVEGVLAPFGWEFDLRSGGGRRQIDVGPVIERYDRRIGMTMLGDFILIGHESVGSFALTDAKTNLFAVSVGGLLKVVKDTVNEYAVPRLFRLNQKFPQDRFPTLVHGDIEAPNPTEIANFVKELTGIGALTPGPEIERYMRRIMNLPEKENDEYDEEELAQMARQSQAAAESTNGTGAQQGAGGSTDLQSAGSGDPSRTSIQSGGS